MPTPYDPEAPGAPRPAAPLSPEQQELLALLLAEDLPAGDGAAGTQPAPLPASVVTLNVGGGEPPLFGVGVFHFRRLARYLGSDRPMYGLLGLDLDDAGQYLQQVEELAAHYVRDIRSVQPEGPYHLLGFCFGGLVAYEMARQLEASGARVGLVALLTASRPDCPAEEACAAPAADGRLRAHLRGLRDQGATYLIAWARARWRFESTRLRTLTQRLILAAYRAGGARPPRWLNGAASTAPEIEGVRTARYVPGPYRGAVTVIGHEGGGEESAEALARQWRPLVGEVRALNVPGDHHMGSLKEPHVRAFAAHLRELLDAA